MRDAQSEEGQAGAAPSTKFPRTPHLAGPGRTATPDDVVLSASETEALLQGGHRIVLEEKVDGANIGLSLDASTGRICIQNRSHVADIEGSAQFSKMKGWLEQKKPELYAVLSQGYVLYGEWLQIRHTVAYKALPDWFIAFDLFSTAHAKFLSTAARDAVLAKHAPSIARIRPVRQEGGTASSRQELLALLRRTRSSYRLDGGTPEGIYLRVECGGFLHMRAKLVDPEFKQAIDAAGHWMHKAVETNKVRSDLWEAMDEEEAESEEIDEHAHAASPQEEPTQAQAAEAERLLAEAQARGKEGDYPSALALAGRALCTARAIVTLAPAANARRARAILRALSLEAQALFGLGRYEGARDGFGECVTMLADVECGDEALSVGLRGKCERGLVECERLLEEESVKAKLSNPLEEGSVKAKLSNPRERVLVSTETYREVLLMRNTSWVVPGQILSGSTPKTKEHVLALSEACKVSLVVTLTEEEPLKREWFGSTIRNRFFPVPNYCPPSMEQMKEILRCMEEELSAGGRVFVHCGGGKGRAGTINACWMVRHGLEAFEGSAASYEEAPRMRGDEAVRVLRELRPGSIETTRQERFVSEWCTELWKLLDAAPVPTHTPAPTHTPERIHTPAPTHTAAAEGTVKQREAAALWQSEDTHTHAHTHDTTAGAGAAEQRAAEQRAAEQRAARVRESVSGTEAARPRPHPQAPPPQYPRTPHLDFSPEVSRDDITLPAARSHRLERARVIVTEKLDGGNCCVFDGCVYARTHAHEARAAWFSAAKAKAAELKAFSLVPAHVALFVENMQAIHSIDYGCLSCPIYVISALNVDSNEVLSWYETQALAERAGLATVPVLFDGEFESRDHMQSWMQEETKKPSCVGSGEAEKEGFVVRLREAFRLENLSDCCAKYVRRGHVQTDANFRLTWKQATWSSTASQSASADAGAERSDMRPSAEAAAGAVTEPMEAAANEAVIAAGPLSEGLGAAGLPEDIRSPAAAAGDGGQAKAPAHSGKKGSSKRGAHSKMCAPAGPKFVMLVGMPGSGKSTFWELLRESMKDGPEVYVRVSQDELGSRGACEDEVGRVLGGRGSGQGVVLDRCNCAAADRATWLALAMQNPKRCACVFFDFDQDTCTKRVAARIDHPTIPFGRGGRAVASHAKLLEAPTLKEGFSKVYRITCEADAQRIASIILSRS